jgi:signal transduction histidine kinase
MGLFYAVVVGFVVGIDRISEWMLVLIWEIDASRTVQARLAVAGSTCIPGDAQVAFAWVLREATTNVIRHSNATTCTIELGSQPRTEAGAADTAVIQIRNDGSPTPEPFHAPGHGLAGLRERMMALGGHFAAGPQPGGWFTVDAQLPMTQNAPVMTGESAP